MTATSPAVDRQAGSPAAVRREFRERLLPSTVRHAAERVPAYAKLFAGEAERVETLADLVRLPLVDKKMVLGDADAFRDPGEPAGLVQHTGGTSGRTLFIHRGPAELEFVRRFFAVVDQEEPSPTPLCISFVWNHHGEPTPIPYRGRVLDVDLNDSYWDLTTLVSQPWVMTGTEPGEAVLVGLESQLRRLTCRLVEAGFEFERSCVASLHSSGDLITSRLRRWYETIWNAPLVDTYSMTELFGGASECPECGHWHFDPYLVGEVVDPFDRTPVAEGCGVLVATCLYPFVQKQPFIRYVTGDLVEIGPPCSYDSLGWRWLGRLGNSVVERTPRGAEILLASGIAYDVLDDFPDVASSAPFKSESAVADPSALGHLKFGVDTHGQQPIRRLKVSIETRYAAYQYPERAERLLREARAALIARHPALARRLEEGSIEFTVEAALPGTLSSFQPDEVE